VACIFQRCHKIFLALALEFFLRSFEARDARGDFFPLGSGVDEGEGDADGGGADAALALTSHVGFLPPQDPLQRRTLDLIERRLDRNGLLDRYEGRPDELADPCGPFVFPTFWMATALQAAGGDGREHFRAAVGARGSLGLFGEVVDPRDGTPLGNYPQVQSHAAFLNAATEYV